MSDGRSYCAGAAVRDGSKARSGVLQKPVRGKGAAEHRPAGSGSAGSRFSGSGTVSLKPTPFSELRDLLTVSAAARRLGISRCKLAQAVKNGELAGYRPGARTVWVEWRSVLRWLYSKRIPSADHARARAAEIVADQKKKETAAE